MSLLPIVYKRASGPALARAVAFADISPKRRSRNNAVPRGRVVASARICHVTLRFRSGIGESRAVYVRVDWLGASRLHRTDRAQPGCDCGNLSLTEG
jgi:hypothetical protein